MYTFPTDLEEIENRIDLINPEAYAQTRNYKEGAVTLLSPYISRGVISTKQIFNHIKELDLPWIKVEKLVQELAWRDYWQQVWLAMGEAIKADLKHAQAPVFNIGIPSAVLNGKTGIDAVDEAIREFYKTGYMHNHMRMYVASICCNIANSHWLQPAKWMFSNLLDGDLASNHLSWQWVAGTFSNKKYVANQANINKFFKSTQQHTFLDIDYDKFDTLSVPQVLLKTEDLHTNMQLPSSTEQKLEHDKTTLVYTYYNLDPYWYRQQKVQRVFLMEPSFFEENPVSQRCQDFALALMKNIEGCQLFVGEYSDLIKQVDAKKLHFKEHPSNEHFNGIQEERDWICSTKGYYASFFSFWKKCKKEIAWN